MKTKVNTLGAAMLLAIGLFSGAAHADAPVAMPCADGTLSPGYLACSGAFSGNLGGALDTNQLAQVSSLFASGGFSYLNTMIYAKSNEVGSTVFGDDATDLSINFLSPKKGAFVIGLKQADFYSFYLMNGGTTGLSTINFNTLGVTDKGGSLGLSHAVFVGEVPEPQTYALMLAGLGLMGFLARRRKAS